MVGFTSPSTYRYVRFHLCIVSCANYGLLAATVLSSGPKAEQKGSIVDFIRGDVFPVLIIGYELLRKHAEDLSTLKDVLLVCDEGHRVKNSSGNLTISALTSINTARRVLLTGTPVQNDLTVSY